MKITFHGAAQTTTGSMHLVEANGKKILLDCGLYQGHRKEAFEKNRNIPFDPKTLDAVILLMLISIIQGIFRNWSDMA